MNKLKSALTSLPDTRCTQIFQPVFSNCLAALIGRCSTLLRNGLHASEVLLSLGRLEVCEFGKGLKASQDTAAFSKICCLSSPRFFSRLAACIRHTRQIAEGICTEFVKVRIRYNNKSSQCLSENPCTCFSSVDLICFEFSCDSLTSFLKFTPSSFRATSSKATRKAR